MNDHLTCFDHVEEVGGAVFVVADALVVRAVVDGAAGADAFETTIDGVASTRLTAST